MMPYMVGIDPEADELIIGDRRNNRFFARAPKTNKEEVCNMVQAANEAIHGLHNGLYEQAKKCRTNQGAAMLLAAKRFLEGNCSQFMDGCTELWEVADALAGAGAAEEAAGKRCECHERDGSYSCDFCKTKGVYGHMEKPPGT